MKPSLRITNLKMKTFLWILALSFFGLNIETNLAFARAGGGRSSGRSSSPSPSAPYSRPYSSPNKNYQDNSSGNSYRPEPTNQPSSPRGGFMRGLAGGLAGGFLGSMLFNSMGNASGSGYGGGGGVGLLEIIVLGALGFLAFRWWKSRKEQPKTHISYPSPSMVSTSGVSQYSPESDSQFAQNSAGMTSTGFDQQPSTRGTNEGPAISQEDASELFFRVQAAWTRRDLTSVKRYLNSELLQTLETDLAKLIEQKQINRLENISVRRTEIVSRWRESDGDFSTVRFSANLLDYNVDESTNKLVSGSNTEPVRFEEEWVFKRANNTQDWQLVGIQQLT